MTALRRRSLIALLSLCLVLGGCRGRREKILRIVVIPKGLTHEFWQSILRGARRAADDLTNLGTATEIIWDGPLKENDFLAQIRIMDRRISTDVDGIVLAPQHSRTMVGSVARAVLRGIPVVIMDSGLDASAQDLIVKYVATDNENGGYEAAKHLIHVLRDKDGKNDPRLILFRYQVGSESTEKRERGFERFIEEQETAGSLKVQWLSRDRYAGATRDTAMREALPLLNRFRGQIDGIFAPNESSANGMLDALRSLGLNKQVRLMGFDSSEPLLQAIEVGDIEGLIVQDPYKMGFLGVWTLVQHICGSDVGGNRAGEVAELVSGFSGLWQTNVLGAAGIHALLPDLMGVDRRNPDPKVLSTGEHLITRENLSAIAIRQLFVPELQERRNLIRPTYLKRRPAGEGRAP
jgi:ribose transport system substrate-binding protein